MREKKETEHWLKTKEVMLHYKIRGEGIPLLMLHGNGENLHLFDRQAKFYAKYFKVIRMDSRDHGLSRLRSEKKKKELDFHQFSDDIIAILDKENIKKVIVLGFSDGANAALIAACDEPKRFLAIIAIGGNLHPLGLRFSLFSTVLLRYYILKFLLRFPMTHRMRSIAEQKYRLIALMAKHPIVSSQELKQISVPVLFIAGENDVIRKNHTVWMKRQILNAKLVIIKKAGHSSMFDDMFRQKDQYRQVIYQFLKELGLWEITANEVSVPKKAKTSK